MSGETPPSLNSFHILDDLLKLLKSFTILVAHGIGGLDGHDGILGIFDSTCDVFCLKLGDHALEIFSDLGDVGDGACL